MPTSSATRTSEARGSADVVRGQQAASAASVLVCPVCHSTRVSPYCQKDGATYHSCRDCRVLFQHPAPDRARMIDYANTEYDSGAYREYVEARDMKLEHFRRRMARMRPHVTTGRLLDVGSACGYFLEVAAAEGFDVQGVEFSRSAIAAASESIRPRILHAGIEALQGAHDGRYDLVTAFDLIEHLEQPLDFLTQVRRLLRPGGVLAISTPDADHWLRPLMASHWPMLQPMQHLTIFSRRAVAIALERTGFDATLVETTHKVINFDYLLDQIRPLTPRLSSTLRTLTRVVPNGLMRRQRAVNIGEFLAIARRTA